MKNPLQLVTLFFLLALSVKAQQGSWQELTLQKNNSFKEMCKQIDQYFEKNTAAKENNEAEGSEYNQYRQWKWFWESRLTHDGFLPDAELIKKSFAEANAIKSSNKLFNTPATCPWSYIDITSNSGGYWGMGRTTSVVFHPTNDSIYYLTCPGGGVWKTIDAGAHYTCIDAGLPYGATSFIVMDQQHPDTLYLSNGDDGGWWQYSSGVYKTTDGGQTWAATGLNFATTNTSIYALEINPNNSNQVWCATSSGLYVSNNGGISWSLSVGGTQTQVKCMPGNGNIIYRVNQGKIFRSVNNGVSWTMQHNFNNNNKRIYLTTTPLNTAQLAAIVEMPSDTNNLYQSTDTATTFTFHSALPETPVHFGYSPTSLNTFYVGDQNVHRFKTGDTAWTKLTHWHYLPPYKEVHADVHYIGYSDNNKHVYFCNDGGIYQYNEASDAWTDRSAGLLNHLIYRIANATNSSLFMLSGTQDNGGRRRTGTNTWANQNGGDGMEVAITPNDTNIFYTSYVMGKGLCRNNGNNWTNIHLKIYNIPGNTDFPQGNWLTPYELVPQNSTSIIAAYDTIFKSTNQGNNWVAISGSLSGGNGLTDLEVCPSDSNIIFASDGNKLFRTFDGGQNWSTISLPGTNYRITRITFHPNNPNIVWVTRGGYNAYNTGTAKVYQSTDAGATWQSFSTGLPDVPHNCIIYENGSADRLFAANDLGVYYRDSTMSSWQAFGSGLPVTLCTDLKISYVGNKLRVGTWGRGIWEVDLCNTVTTAVPAEIVANDKIMLYPNPGNGTFTVTGRTIEEIERIRVFSAEGKEINAQINNVSTWQKLVQVNYAAGAYIVEVKTSSGISRLKMILQ